MHELDRCSMLKVVAALSLGPYSALADANQAPAECRHFGDILPS